MSIETLHPGPTSAEVIRDIFAMHFPPSRSYQVIDLTYGKGTFWKWDYKSAGVLLLTNDLYVSAPNQWPDQHLALDFCDFTGGTDRGVEVVVFDPPFSAMGPASDGQNEHSERYGAARHQGHGIKNVYDIRELLVGGIKEACRIATRGVIVKTQDVVESGRYHDNVGLAGETICEAGWWVEDKVELFTSRRPQPDAARGAKVKHFRNRPSYFIVAYPNPPKRR